jgi:hypothetical protein
LPVIKEMGEDAFKFVFEGSDVLANLTEGTSPETRTDRTMRTSARAQLL